MTIQQKSILTFIHDIFFYFANSNDDYSRLKALKKIKLKLHYPKQCFLSI